ncbi:MAG: hypothetical protein E6R03_04125 [Hyphomicrobiaceae bacterium]|nr:MAG: hypothetical protein E6R03_04125 [Hyphomicrobiaceae bacterium]
MSARKKRTWRWVTRDASDTYYSKALAIHTHHAKPTCDQGVFFIEDGAMLACLEEWAKLTSIDIQPGECVKVEFSAKVVK